MTYKYKCGTTETEQNDTPTFMQVDTSDRRRMMFIKVRNKQESNRIESNQRLGITT